MTMHAYRCRDCTLYRVDTDGASCDECSANGNHHEKGVIYGIDVAMCGNPVTITSAGTGNAIGSCRIHIPPDASVARIMLGEAIAKCTIKDQGAAELATGLAQKFSWWGSHHGFDHWAAVYCSLVDVAINGVF